MKNLDRLYPLVSVYNVHETTAWYSETDLTGLLTVDGLENAINTYHAKTEK